MNKTSLAAFCLSGLLGVCVPSLAAESTEGKVPSVDSTGPTNPTPPTLPAPGTGVDDGVGTGIDGHDNAPTPGTDGTGRQEKHDSDASPKTPGESVSPSPKGG